MSHCGNEEDVHPKEDVTSNLGECCDENYLANIRQAPAVDICPTPCIETSLQSHSLKRNTNRPMIQKVLVWVEAFVPRKQSKKKKKSGLRALNSPNCTEIQTLVKLKNAIKCRQFHKNPQFSIRTVTKSSNTWYSKDLQRARPGCGWMGLVYFGTCQAYPSRSEDIGQTNPKDPPLKTNPKKVKCTFSGLGIRRPASGARRGGSAPLAGDKVCQVSVQNDNMEPPWPLIICKTRWWGLSGRHVILFGLYYCNQMAPSVR